MPFKRNYLWLYGWQFTPIFWRVRQFLKATTFRIKKIIFGIRGGYERSTEHAGIFLGIGRIIVKQGFFALLIVATLKGIEHIAYQHDFLSPSRVKGDAQLNYITALLGVSATLLGLYFTAISVVASTAYSRAPGDVRSLIIQEKVGGFYFNALALFAGIVAILSTLLSLKYSVGILNTLMVSGFCLFSIFGFVTIGLRAFEFFNPAKLVNHLNRRLRKSVVAVCPGAFQWQDESFQKFRQQEASALLGNYSHLVTVAAQKDRLDEKAMVDLGIGALAILSFYATQKARIPSNSQWFKRNRSHKNWLLSASTELEVALATSTSLRPDSVPDNLWFEREIVAIISQIITELKSRQNQDGIERLSVTFYRAMESLGKAFCVEEGAYIFRRISASLASTTGLVVLEDFEDQGRADAMERLAVVENYACALMGFILTLTERIEGFDEVFLLRCISREQSANSHAKETALPRALVRDIESILEKIAFEKKVTGQTITPNWFQLEVLARTSSNLIGNFAEELVKLVEETCATPLSAQLRERNYFILAQLIQRGIEVCAKSKRALEICQKRCELLSALNKSKDYEWTAHNWTELEDRLAKARRYMIVILSRRAPQLARLKRSASIPDYFGQTYTVLAEECYAALSSGNVKLFYRLYRQFFKMVRLASYRIKEDLMRLTSPNLNLIAEPYLDVMALSGYAAIYSEFYGNQSWAGVVAVWDRYLSSFQGSIPNFFRGLLAEDRSFGVSSRYTHRFRWKRDTEDRLSQRGLLSQEYFPIETPDNQGEAAPLVKAFAQGTRVATTAETVFQSQFLFARPEASGIPKPFSVGNFERSLARFRGEEKEKEVNDE